MKNIDVTAARMVAAPRTVNPAEDNVLQCVMSDPGCSIQLRIVISDKLTPFVFGSSERLVRTWPRNEVKTVTKVISIVFARSAVTRFAVDGFNLPVEDMTDPQRG